MSIESIQSIKDQMAAIEQSLSQLRRALDTLEPASAKPKTIKIKTKAEPSAEPSPTRAPTAWNLLVQSTVADMRQNGWESWTDAKGTVWPASRRGPIKDKSGAQSEGFVYSGGEHDGKPPGPALGGMLRASYLKMQSDPSAAAKAAAYNAKLDEKRSASAAAPSATPAAPKKAGRPPMTAEQKAEAAAKRAAKASAEQSGSESATESKKAGRPPMTAEQKAAAAAKRAANKAAKASAPQSDAESVHTCSGVPEGWAELLGEKIVPKKVDLSFYPFVYEGKNLLMNDRGDVVDPEEGVWVGRLNKGILDKTVPEPADLEEVTMRE
jgi:hypothetical protein